MNYHQLLLDLRQTLHKSPEPSGQEHHTREIISNFLTKYTNAIIDQDDYYVSAYFDNKANKTIALRADYDAIVNKNGKLFHGCGHDGHSTILCGVSLKINEIKLTKNVLLIFQASEENGQGAKQCLKLLEQYHVSRIYGLHNFPGYPVNKPIIKSETFMCASLGLNVDVYGKQSHASQPELGNNPIYVMSQLIQWLHPLSELTGYQQFGFNQPVFATVIHLDLGAKNAYGISPAHLNCQMTLRAYQQSELQMLVKFITDYLDEHCLKTQLDYQITMQDEFPDTVNPTEEVLRLNNIFLNHQIQPIIWEQPFRASEDFGWYLKAIPGCFFGVGCGENHPALHQDDYEFNDEIIECCVNYFMWIVQSEEEVIK